MSSASKFLFELYLYFTKSFWDVIFQGWCLLKLLTNAYLKRHVSRGTCRGNAFLMKPRWQSKAESPELQWPWKLEVLSHGQAPRVPVLSGTSLPALLGLLHHHCHLGSPAACNLQSALQAFALDLDHTGHWHWPQPCEAGSAGSISLPSKMRQLKHREFKGLSQDDRSLRSWIRVSNLKLCVAMDILFFPVLPHFQWRAAFFPMTLGVNIHIPHGSLARWQGQGLHFWLQITWFPQVNTTHQQPLSLLLPLGKHLLDSGQREIGSFRQTILCDHWMSVLIYAW